MIIELGGKIPFPDTINRKMKAVNRDTELITNYDVCSSGCYLYPKNNEEITQCPKTTCRKSRYSDELSHMANQQMYIVSIGAFLTDKLLDDEQRALFDYRHQFDTTIHRSDRFIDIFSGDVYQNLYKEKRLFQNPSDIALIIVVDGFQPHSKPITTLTSINCYIMNYSPLER